MGAWLPSLPPRLLLAAVLLALPTRAGAGEEAGEGASVSAEIDVVSQYVWRTLTYSDGVVVQPSVTAGLGHAELNVWANVDPSFTGAGRLNEIDYALAWGLVLGPVEVTPSLLLYTFPQLGAANTGELQVELRGVMPGHLGAFVRHSSDVLDYPGASFTNAGVEREWAFGGDGSLTLAAQVGRGSRRFSDAYLPGVPALNVAGLAASASIPMGGGWSARPHVDWLEVVDAGTRALLPVHTPVAFGIALVRSIREP